MSVYLSGYSGPSASGSYDISRRFDYSGQDEHVARQDAVSELRGKKFADLYSGKLEDSVAKGGRIRDLVAALQVNAPGASERFPVSAAKPLVRVESAADSGQFKADGDTTQYDAMRPPAESTDADGKAKDGKPLAMTDRKRSTIVA